MIQFYIYIYIYIYIYVCVCVCVCVCIYIQNRSIFTTDIVYLFTTNNSDINITNDQIYKKNNRSYFTIALFNLL